MNPVLLRVLRNPPKLILDDVFGSVAAYSLRRLRAYAIYAIRIRRSSDNAEMNIGFSGENLAIGALLAFVGSASAYVTTIYDQSGNANHATQTTAANQPRIVNTGIIDRDFDATKAAALYPTFASASASGVNIVSNGDFSGGTTGWSSNGGVISASSNTLTQTGNGSLTEPSITQSYSFISGRRYFVRAKVRVTNAESTFIRITLQNVGGNIAVTQNTPTQNQWYTLSGVITVDASAASIRVYQGYVNNGVASGKVMEVQEVMCVDVTELGQPTMYFDGTNDVMTIANSASVDILGAPLMMNAVFSSSGQTGYVLCKNGASGVEIQYAINYNNTNTALDTYLEGASRQSTLNASIPNNIQKVVSSVLESGEQQGYISGTASGVAGNYNSTLTSRANMQIGARSNNAGGTAWLVFFKGNISEIIILTSTSGRSKLERNQGKFYQLGVA